MKKPKPKTRPAGGGNEPSKTDVRLTALLFAESPETEKALRRELANLGITTANQLRVVAQAELVWVKTCSHKYPNLCEILLNHKIPPVLTNPTLFGICACQTIEQIERDTGKLKPIMLEATLVGYAIMWESALDIDQLALNEDAKKRRQRGTDTTKAKAAQRRSLVQSLLEQAAKSRNMFDIESTAQHVGVSTDTIYRYLRQVSRNNGD